ncbi:TonB-linked SusC/RagA family outer membrane protein [Mucilaginibacter yixingensis]|uniref:TonB-linked SusC/RagA family outer membrane protein n=1 Tax=Mucilaginibacter yixingensis TaxID=1295612 RepID=A0A2T5J4U3_9SPHI|nr:SusC/RagA family TonB-linked outer membrane protein [Mucilaginibacter yixingensis]PTQ92644.1 TonB-linked SusC/RagA family outer membrane protein [Mucilaginibacter yixingensis]
MKQILPKLQWLLVALLVTGLGLSKVSAQNVIRGIITDENNQPLPGVSVMIAGSRQGTSTNINGRFTISATQGQTLTVSFIGYKTQELTIGADANLAVQMKAEGKELSEIVVTALGVKKEVQKLGYSQSQIKGEELTTARDANPLNSMAGKVAGLQIGASSEFFGAPTVVLRGSKDVLYVVDGEPVNSDTFDFNADDIESYTILKGPNAAALYGFRGINGAIIITTKKGSKDKKGWQVDYNSVNEMEKGFIVLPQSQVEYGRGTNYQYTYGNVLYDNNQRLPEWGPRFDGVFQTQQYDSPYDPTTGIRQKTPWVARGANNFENFVQTGLITTNTLSAAASGSNYDIHVSYGHTYQKGDFPNTKLNIDNFKLSAGYDINSKLRFEGDVNVSEQYSPNVPDVVYSPNSYVYMFKVYGSADYDIRDIKNYYQGPQGVPGLTQYAPEYGRENNAWFIANEWLKGRQKDGLYGSLRLQYKFNKDLNLSLRTALNTYNQLSTEDVPASTNLNQYLSWYTFGWFGDYREDQRRLLENNTDLILNYNHKFTDWNISGIAGASERSFTYDSHWATTQQLAIPGVYDLNNSVGKPYVYTFGSKMQVYSGFYSVDIGYKNYFNLNTTNRVDHLSTLPSSNSTYLYPSVALSSVVSDWVKLPEFISFLKLRASFADVKGGLTAPTIGTSYNALNSTAAGTGWNSKPVIGLLGYGSEIYTPYNGPVYVNESPVSTTSIYNNTPSANISNTISNPNIKPFDVKSYEYGMDVKFLGNRLGLNATYFTTTNGPNIFQLPVSTATTYTNRLINGVTTQKDGFEIELMGSVLKNPRGLNWDINANWSTYKETLKAIYGDLPYLEQNGHDYKVGERLDAIYGTKFVRDPNGNIVNSTGGLPLSSGGGIAQNGLLGYANPDFSFGITNTFRYKNWSLSFQFDGRVGGKIYDFVYYHAMNGGTDLESASGAFGAARLAEWNSTAEGTKAATPKYVGPGVIITSGTPHFTNGQIDNMKDLTFAPNNVPVLVQSYISSGIGANADEYYMISRTYAKLREASIGYSLPAKMLQRAFIKKVSFSIVGRNLLYFAQRKDIDLDQFASGYNASDRTIVGTNSGSDLSSPTVRRFGFNVNLSF